MRISKDRALGEITLRRYERPSNMQKREIVRRVCLSLGLLQPGDSRDVIVDMLYLLYENRGKGELASSLIKSKVINMREKQGLPVLGVADSNIRRQLKRLKMLYLVEKFNSGYRITENAALLEIFKERIEGFYLKSIIERIKEYLSALEK